MLSILTAGLILANVTAYPGFGDRGFVTPRSIEQAPRIETTTDKGPVVEIIVRCQTGAAIISYSKIERKFCTPKQVCDTSMAAIVARSCT